ncbi:hypothetical protein GDO81_023066 [Engystomops pustulosus]|uniref:Uncharacterized protein n=1 Tax=Engystomops pustulosus TaxID=76066 RepID=A0AAV6Z9W8_ENGPU|nr:hypothetical protein GDO81_023066 [Engystomops pustulosus]
MSQGHSWSLKVTMCESVTKIPRPSSYQAWFIWNMGYEPAVTLQNSPVLGQNMVHILPLIIKVGHQYWLVISLFDLWLESHTSFSFT